MADTLKDLLVKPYIDVYFDEGHRIRIPAAYRDCRAFIDKYPELKEKLDVQAIEKDPKALLQSERDLLQYMCGPEVGGQIMDMCVDYLTDGTDLPAEQVSLGIVKAVDYVASLWLEQTERMTKQHNSHVESYLSDADDVDVL